MGKAGGDERARGARRRPRSSWWSAMWRAGVTGRLPRRLRGPRPTPRTSG